MVDEKINVNKADADALASLPLIGETLAARIIEYRENIKRFEELIELTAVPGIDEELVRAIMDKISLVDEVVDINEANADELASLPGIGDALAQRIIAFREGVHPFRETIELSVIQGISSDLVNSLAEKIKVAIVNVNKASVDELVTLNGIGRTLAERIVARRETDGEFLTLSSLTEVNGISQRLVNKLMDQLTLGVDIEDKVAQNGHFGELAEEAEDAAAEVAEAVEDAVAESEEVVEAAASEAVDAVEETSADVMEVVEEEVAEAAEAVEEVEMASRTAVIDLPDMEEELASVEDDASEAIAAVEEVVEEEIEQAPLTEEIFTPEDEDQPEAVAMVDDYASKAGTLAAAGLSATQETADSDDTPEAAAVMAEVVEEVVEEVEVAMPVKTAVVDLPDEAPEPVIAEAATPEPVFAAAAPAVAAAVAPVSTTVSNEESNQMSEITPDDTRSSSPPPPARTQAASQSGGGSWMTILFASIFGALGGAILTIFILAAMNGGTLRFVQAAEGVQNEINAVRQSQLDMTTGVDTLSAELNTLSSDVEAMGANMAEGMAEMEANVNTALTTVQDELGLAQGSIADLETTTTELGAEVAEVAESAETFDSFLGGLRDLLFDVTGPPEGMVPADEAGAVITPTVEAPPTPTPFATLAPSGANDADDAADEAEEGDDAADDAEAEDAAEDAGLEEGDDADAADEADDAADDDAEGDAAGEEEPAADASPTPFNTIAPTRTPQPTSTPFPTATPRP